MTDQWFTVNSRKYDFSLSRSWQARLVEKTVEAVVLEGFFEKDVAHHHLGLIKEGTRSLETFFLDRWYNYFAFFEPSGEFRNYYVNISMPPRLGPVTVDYVDLDIDLILWPNGDIAELDLDEFFANSKLYGYPLHVRRRVLELKNNIKRDPIKYITALSS